MSAQRGAAAVARAVPLAVSALVLAVKEGTARDCRVCAYRPERTHSWANVESRVGIRLTRSRPKCNSKPDQLGSVLPLRLTCRSSFRCCPLLPCCSIPRENVLVVVQPSHPGYAYDSERRTWRAGDAAHCLPLGRPETGCGPRADARTGGRYHCCWWCNGLGPAQVTQARSPTPHPVRRSSALLPRVRPCPSQAAATACCSWRGRARRRRWGRTAC